MSDKISATIVSLLAITGFFVFGLYHPNISGDAALILTGVVMGVLATGFVTALNFWLGSSAGSRSKDSLIATQLPQPPATPTLSPPASLPAPPPDEPLVPLPPPPKPVLEPASPLAPVPPLVPANVLTIVGKMSHFGGPNDTGMRPDDGLALCEPGEEDKFPPGLFLPSQPPGTTGLARRLNPDAHYIACQWNYKQTPRGWLQKTLVRCTANGVIIDGVQPIDYGPNENTGRVADLSPGLEKALGLTTDGTVTVQIPLPPGSPAVAPIVPDAGTHLKVLTNAQLDAKFGPFPYTEGPAGTIIPDPAWVAANIVTVTIPQLANLVKGGTVECHKAAAAPLQEVFADIEAAGFLGDILTWDGLWVPRHIGSDPRRGISRHSRGLACDINAEWNPYGGRQAPPGAKGNNYRIAPIFEKHGFAWGAWFGRTVSLDSPPASDTDGMHFEYAGISGA